VLRPGPGLRLRRRRQHREGAYGPRRPPGCGRRRRQRSLRRPPGGV